MKYFLVVVLSLSLNASTSATDYFVRISGNDKNDGLSPKSAFQSIEFAVNHCTSNRDRIYVGGGEYAVGVSRTVPKNQQLEIIGDLTGKRTGDPGRPVFIGKQNTWTMFFSGGHSIEISGIQFRGGRDGNYYGLNLRSVTNSIHLADCVFSKLYLATDLYNNGRSTIDSCQLDDIGHIGLYVRSSTLEVENCLLTNCRYALYGQDLKSVRTRKSEFVSDGAVVRHAVYFNNCSVDLDSINVAGYDTAVYSLNSHSLSVNDSKISDIKSWGIYGSGSKCEVSNVSISGMSTKSGYGLSYSATTGKRPTITNVKFHNLYCGLRSDGDSPYDYKNVTSAGNHIGYFVNNMPALKSTDIRKGGLYVDNNVFGLYVVASSMDKRCDVSLTKAEISNNDYGLYTNNSSVHLNGCRFQNNSRAVYILNSPETDISNCDVSDNTARNTWSHFGIRIDASRISVTDTRIINNDYGLYLTNLANETPKLSNLQIDSNKNYGLLVSRGMLHLDNSSNVQVSGSRYGLWSNGADLTVEGWTGPTKSDYPYYIVGGSLDMRGCDIAGGMIGVYAHTLKAMNFEKCNFQGQSNHGLYAHLPGQLTVKSCSIDSAKSHGLYCYTLSAPTETISISNLTITNSQIGARFIGVPVSAENIQNLVLHKNSQGLRVEQAPLHLTHDLNIDLAGNQYAVMSYNGSLTADGFASAGNAIALYVHRSPTQLANTRLSGTSYGAIFYGSPVTARGLSVSSASNGIYHDPQDQPDCPLTIEESEFSNVGNISIRAIGRDNSKAITLKKVAISGGNYGLYFSGNKVLAEDIQLSDVKTYAVYAARSESQLNRLIIHRSGSWAIYGNEGTMDLLDTQVYGGRGVLLATQSSMIVNTIVSGSSFGVYLNHKDGQYAVLNSTIAGILNDGILANLGRTHVVNSIIQSSRFGINDVSGNNTVHDFNIISSKTSFRNTAAQKNEILKSPMFVNATASDYRLQSGSPAINNGQDLSSISSRDIVGAGRGSFGRFEIGAYEYLGKDGSLRVLDWDETAQ